METSSTQQDLSRLFESASGYFALLSEPMRLRILHAICDHERTVNDIVAATGATQSSVSRHLNAMHRAGALTRRRDRNFTWYGVADSTLTELCRTVCVHLAGREPLDSGREAFARSSAPGASPDHPASGNPQ